MPGSFVLASLAQVTGLTGSPAAGGSLAASTTYYYKVFAYDAYIGIMSPRSATFSITTDTTNKTVNLSWTALAGFTPVNTYRCYVVLRNTSDSFPDDQNICIMKVGATHYWNWLTTNSFSDTGTYTMGQTCNFIDGLPCVYMYGGTDAAPITMWDLYQWSLTYLPGRIQPIINTAYCDFESSGWKKNGMSWLLHCSWHIGSNGSTDTETHFKNLYVGTTIIYGRYYTTGQARMTFGTRINSNKDTDYSQSHTLLVQCPAPFEKVANGRHNLYGLRLQQGGRNWGGYAYSGWNHPYVIPKLIDLASGSEIFDCEFAMAGNGYWITGQTGANVPVKRCRFPGVAVDADIALEKPYITQTEGLGFRHYGGVTVTEPTVSYSSYDLIWKTQYAQTVIDGTFRSHDQTDNRPWYVLGYGLDIGGSLTFKNTVIGRVKSKAGTALAGAAVLITDIDGTSVYSGTTDANGAFNAGAVTARIVSPTSAVTGVSSIGQAHEDNHIANGYLSRVYKTPHTITVSKTGFKNYVGKLDLTRKLDLEIALTPLGLPVQGEEMILKKNTAGQKVTVFAWDDGAGAPKTGDAAGITAKISKDGGAYADTDDVNPTELGRGVYSFDLTQSETNADLITVAAQSSTANVSLRHVNVSTVASLYLWKRIA